MEVVMLEADDDWDTSRSGNNVDLKIGPLLDESLL
jgi:hypothetical protein